MNSLQNDSDEDGHTTLLCYASTAANNSCVQHKSPAGTVDSSQDDVGDDIDDAIVVDDRVIDGHSIENIIQDVGNTDDE
jgi:hypothetical protein